MESRKNLALSQPKVVLVVEDDIRVNQLLVRLLRSHNYTVLKAATVEEAAAIVLAKSHQLNLLTLDLRLSGKHGNELLAQLQTLAPHLLVVVVTAIVEELKPTAQVKAVFSKPFDVAQLLTTLAQLSD